MIWIYAMERFMHSQNKMYAIPKRHGTNPNKNAKYNWQGYNAQIHGHTIGKDTMHKYTDIQLARIQCTNTRTYNWQGYNAQIHGHTIGKHKQKAIKVSPIVTYDSGYQLSPSNPYLKLEIGKQSMKFNSVCHCRCDVRLEFSPDDRIFIDFGLNKF